MVVTQLALTQYAQSAQECSTLFDRTLWPTSIWLEILIATQQDIASIFVIRVFLLNRLNQPADHTEFVLIF